MSQTDIHILLIGPDSEVIAGVYECLVNYRQLAFEIQRAVDGPQALAAAEDGDIEIAIVDVSDQSDSSEKLMTALVDGGFPLAVLAVVASEKNDYLEKGAGEIIAKDDINGLPRALIQLWIRSRAVKNDVGSEDGEPSQAVDLIEAQKDIVERFRQTEATFATMMPEGDRTFDELEEEEKLQLKLDLVETYINITQIYFARSDEESKDIIGKFCNNLFALRFPPKELTSVHIGALELMLTEPGQPHRQGIISQNRLVFIDILINLIGQYYSLARE